MKHNKKRNPYSLSHHGLHHDERVIAVARTALTLSKVALVMVGDIMEGIVKGFHPHPYYHTFCEHRTRSFGSTLSRLQRKGYVETVLRNGVREYYLTQKGILRRNGALHEIFLRSARSEPWDGKWRVIMFDVPERFRKRRDFLRVELNIYGFMQLQKSVWVTPYKVADDFTEVIENLGMEKYINFAVVETWYNDSDLRKMFQIQ